MHILAPTCVSASNPLFEKGSKARGKENTNTTSYILPVIALMDAIDQEYKEQ